jgi:hypothetical protein
MFTGIQKSNEFHKCYWLIKYLNPKLVSWDTINTCWTYMNQFIKIISYLKVVIGNRITINDIIANAYLIIFNPKKVTRT